MSSNPAPPSFPPQWVVDLLPMLVAVLTGFVLAWLFSREKGEQQPLRGAKDEDAGREPPRNFTLAQLQKFAGNEDDTPVYISLDRTVFDVSGSEFYEKEGPYHIFAGHEASRCLAKMSFAEEDLDSLDLSDLTHADRDSLDGWIMKFRHGKCYPVVGKLVPPPEEPQIFTISELQEYKGEGDIPEGAAAAPIYVAVKGDVFDMSYGGSSHYGKGCGYHLFAGRDASRALAKMSFDQHNLDNPSTDDLTEDERKTLDDWYTKFRDGKGYPIVGKLSKK